MPTSIELSDRLFSDLSNAGLAIEGIHGVVSPWNPAVVTVQPSNLQAAAQTIINAFDGSQAAQDAWAASVTRAQRDAVLFMISPEGNARAYRAVASIMVDEINAVRGWIVSFKAQVALATTLADLKSRVSGLPDLPDRTIAQAKTAYITKVNTGT